MNIFGIGTSELLLILVIAIVVVGPERVVEFSRQLGRWLAKFRAMSDSVTKEFKEAIDIDEIKKELEGAASALTEDETPTEGKDGAAAQPAADSEAAPPAPEAEPAALPAPEAVSAAAEEPPAEPAPADELAYEAALLQAQLAAAFTDGEIEVVPVPPVEAIEEGLPRPTEAGEEPVSVATVELVGEETDVAPIAIEEVLVVADHAEAASTQTEGQPHDS